LTTGPDPLGLDLAALGLAAGQIPAGVPGGAVPLPALRAVMLRNTHAYALRDAVWAELIARARTGGPAWVIAAVGMAMPALVRAARRLAPAWAGDPDDLDGEILTGYLAALRHDADPRAPRAYARLCRAAHRAGHAAVRAQQPAIPLDDPARPTAGHLPARPYGHPDLLVDRAVALGVITAGDARDFIDTRLDHHPVSALAAARGISAVALRRRVRRTADRLAAALADGSLTGLGATAAQ
jgi:hypothetical protein